MVGGTRRCWGCRAAGVAGEVGCRQAVGVAGQEELPAGVDPVGVVEVLAVWLAAALVEGEDLPPAVRVLQEPLGDVPQGVVALDHVAGLAVGLAAVDGPLLQLGVRLVRGRRGGGCGGCGGGLGMMHGDGDGRWPGQDGRRSGADEPAAWQHQQGQRHQAAGQRLVEGAGHPPGHAAAGCGDGLHQEAPGQVQPVAPGQHRQSLGDGVVGDGRAEHVLELGEGGQRVGEGPADQQPQQRRDAGKQRQDRDDAGQASGDLAGPREDPAGSPFRGSTTLGMAKPDRVAGFQRHHVGMQV